MINVARVCLFIALCYYAAKAYVIPRGLSTGPADATAVTPRCVVETNSYRFGGCHRLVDSVVARSLSQTSYFVSVDKAIAEPLSSTMESTANFMQMSESEKLKHRVQSTVSRFMSDCRGDAGATLVALGPKSRMSLRKATVPVEVSLSELQQSATARKNTVKPIIDDAVFDAKAKLDKRCPETLYEGREASMGNWQLYVTRAEVPVFDSAVAMKETIGYAVLMFVLLAATFAPVSKEKAVRKRN